MSPPEGGKKTGGDAGVGPNRGAVISTRAAVPECVQAAMQVSNVQSSRPQGKGLSPGGVKAPHGVHSSGQLGKRKDGSVALQWVSTVKTDAQNQVPLGPSGKRICWADWCWVRCDRGSCPCHHVDSEEELNELLPEGKFPLAVWALSCEHMGLRSVFPHMGDMFEAQLWLRAILASLYKLKGKIGDCGSIGQVVRPVQVRLSMGEDVVGYKGPEHPQGRDVSQLGSIQLNACAAWMWTIVDWGEDYGAVVTACVSLVGSSILRREPGELEQLALQFTENVAQRGYQLQVGLCSRRCGDS